MPRIKEEDKSSFCIDCLYIFDSLKKYHSRDRCNPCYQKLYMRGKMPTKEIQTHCKVCAAEYDSINAKGKPVTRGAKGLCKSCYTKSIKPKKQCEQCDNQMLSGSKTGLCIVCRQLKRQIEGKRSWKKKVKPLPCIDVEIYESIRRLLVRFKFGNNSIVDNFRVIDAYVDVCENPVFLDTLAEEAQVVEMLRYLKKVYDFNKEVREAKLELEKKKAEHKNKYYKYKKKSEEVKINI
jgi:hypothetical protein